MLRIILFVLVFMLINTAIGIETSKYVDIKENKFSTVIGFVVFLCALQILYYPAQIFNLSFNYIIVASVLLLLIGMYFLISNFKEVKEELLNKKTLIVLISVIIFSFVSSNTFIDIEFSDAATYLNYIAQNININKLNMFNPVTGLKGHEWDIYYLYQGWYHFGAFLCWLINANVYVLNMGSYVANITVSIWALGLIYSFISSFFIVDLLEYFNFKDKISKYVIGIYLLFYANFYYWKIAFSFYGNTFRALLGAILIFLIYRWFKEEKEEIKLLFPIVITAGLSFTSSFLFIAFVIMFSLAIYLFMIKKEKTIYDMFTFVFPMAFYGIIMFGKVYPVILIGGIIFLLLIYVGRLFKPIRRSMYYLDDFFFKHINKIAFVLFPIFLGVVSFYLNFMVDGFIPTYSHFFEDHQNYDMIKDYYFIYSNLLDNVFNVIRWTGIIFIVFKSKSVEDKFIKVMILITLVILLNPLFISAIALAITGIVYYRMVEVVFNPFTEILMFIAVYKLIDFNKISKNVLNSVIVIVVLLGNVFSFVDNKSGLYTFYINGGKETTPLEKISQNEIQAIYELSKLVKEDNNENGVFVVVSQTSALRTYMPNAYQIFTSRDNYYVEARLDETFYHIAKRHYPWIDDGIVPQYELTCGFLQESYGITYVLLEYWENSEFDKASDPCTETYFTGSHYKVKKVIR